MREPVHCRRRLSALCGVGAPCAAPALGGGAAHRRQRAPTGAAAANRPRLAVVWASAALPGALGGQGARLRRRLMPLRPEARGQRSQAEPVEPSVGRDLRGPIPQVRPAEPVSTAVAALGCVRLRGSRPTQTGRERPATPERPTAQPSRLGRHPARLRQPKAPANRLFLGRSAKPPRFGTGRVLESPEGSWDSDVILPPLYQTSATAWVGRSFGVLGACWLDRSPAPASG